ncbi:glycoside hydrolase family 43 protein [Xylariomycetidae sp. FL0641]|nr:glycoside hydrolase family 43 protein [Xylariomycetidae sp. FL0641]
MKLIDTRAWLRLATVLPMALGLISRENSTYYNPILPGFHPDPSCIFVPEWEDTFFCASSSFNAFPGIPLHASKDLQNWKLIGHVLNRREQLPKLAETNRSTSGIWAPTIRYHEGTFWLVTTLVNDELADDDASRWDNIIFQSENPYDPSAWTVATHFAFEGYDTSPFWDVDGTSYIVGAHAYKVYPGIMLAGVDLQTGDVGDWTMLWNGTGGMAPEGPHIYRKDEWYYLLAAEGGTGLEHMVTMARSKDLHGPYVANPANPVLTNANTTSYCEFALLKSTSPTELTCPASPNLIRRWGVALSTRSGPEYLYYPMGRETVMVPVRWDDDDGAFPVWSAVRGSMTGWRLPAKNLDLGGPGPFINEGDSVDFASARLPVHFTHWRYPDAAAYAASPAERPGTLRLRASALNLTGRDGNSAAGGGPPTFVGRRQQATWFTYSVDLVGFAPTVPGEEAGVSVFLTQNHHLDLGVVLLVEEEEQEEEARLYLRYRGISYVPVPDPVVVPVPRAWAEGPLRLQISARNASHYALRAGPPHDVRTLVEVPNDGVSWGFTGVLLGAYCTSNGSKGNASAYFARWRYTPQGQVRS